MASGSQGPKQTHGYFVPLGNCVPSMLQYSGGAGAGGSFLPGVFSAASWTAAGTGGAGAVLSSISSVGAGGLLKDMGKTVVSSNRTFRKVQLVVPNSNTTLSTFGVRGQSGTTGEDFLTGYIELGFEGNGTPAPVAHFGR